MGDLQERILRLEAELQSLKAQVLERPGDGPQSAQQVAECGPTSRRQLLKLAGAAAVGAAGASLIPASPAGATTGTMTYGSSNNAGTSETDLTSSSTSATLGIDNTGTGSGILLGDGGTGTGAGVASILTNGSSGADAIFGSCIGAGAGVSGTSTNGYGLVGAGGLAPLRLQLATSAGAPATGHHQRGEIYVDSTATIFQCVADGTPGTWARVGFNPLVPTRILDTRNGTGGITGPISAGQTVNLTVGGLNGVPTQASALVLNATVTDTTAASFLTIWPQGAALPTASNLNWSPGETIPNLVTVKLGMSSGISIFNALGDVQVVLDLSGFYS